MAAHLRPALVSLLHPAPSSPGVVYPLVVTGIAQVVFPDQANGSLIVKDGKPVGLGAHRPAVRRSEVLLGPAVGHEPVRATTPAPRRGSNLGPTNPALIEAVQGRVDALRAADPGNTAPVPVDLVTASGSGLDPAHQPGGRALPGRPRGAGAQALAGHGADPRRAAHRGAPARLCSASPASTCSR